MTPVAAVIARALGKRGLGGHAAVATAPGFVRLDLTEPDRANDPDAFFDAIDALLRAIHAVAPLGEVVLLSQRAPGSHAWDAWSRDASPPAPGPVYADWRRPVAGEVRDPSLPVPAPDAPRTAAIRAARDGSGAAGEERATARAALEGGPAAVLAKGIVQPKPPRAIVEAGGKGTGWRRRAAGGWIGVGARADDSARANGEPSEVTRVLAGDETDGSIREIAKPRSWPGRWVVDGERVLMVARWGNYGSVIAIDLATGVVTKL